MRVCLRSHLYPQRLLICLNKIPPAYEYEMFAEIAFWPAFSFRFQSASQSVYVHLMANFLLKGHFRIKLN